MTDKTITISNIGGVSSFSLTLKPGVTELTGSNGAGKTCTMNAVSRLFGADVPLEPRDGSSSGEVVGDGVKLVVRKVVRSTGHAEVALADTGHLATLIEPAIKDPDARAKARIRALVALLRMPVDEASIRTLAGDDQVATAAIQEIKDEMIEDLLQACEKIRLVAHRMKRGHEQSSDEAHGRAELHEAQVISIRTKAIEVGGPVDLSLDEARRLQSSAETDYHTARVTCQQRQELEAQQAEIRASLGERPDPSPHARKLEILQGDINAAGTAVREAEKALELAQRQLEDAQTALLVERKTEAETKAALERWDAQATILRREVTGAQLEEVGILEATTKGAAAIVERARLSEEIQRSQEQADAEARKALEHRERAEALEQIAKTVRTRLGDLLAGSPAAGLTIENGRLAVLDETGKALDFETRQSDGQRVRIALQIAKVAYRGLVVPLDGRYWMALDEAHQAEFARIAEEAGLYVLTERPTEGPLAAAHVSTASYSGPTFETNNRAGSPATPPT